MKIAAPSAETPPSAVSQSTCFPSNLEFSDMIQHVRRNSLRQSLGVMWRNRTNGIAIEADRKMDFPSLPRVEECAFSLFQL